MANVADLLRILATSHLAVLAAVIFKGYRRDPSARASVAFIAAVCAHLLAPFLVAQQPAGLWTRLCVAAAVGVPFSFWVCARVHFDDDFRFRAHHLLILAALVALGDRAYRISVQGLGVPEGQYAFWLALPKLIGIVLVIHALLHVLTGARSDLLVSRLRLRYGVLSLSGSLSLLELMGDVVLRSAEARALADLAHVAAVYVLVFGISVAALLVRADMLRPARAEAATPEPALDPELALRLERLLETEKAYRQEGLTIAVLSEKLGAQEYKVRQLINSQLGFRNFNAFLNHYRVREATAALADPARQHLGVAQIAFEVGYGSLGPFNKAFKELNGVTPTEFRAARVPRDAAAASPAHVDSESEKPFPEKKETGSERSPILGR